MEIEIDEIILDEDIVIDDIELDLVKLLPELEDLEVNPSGEEQNFKSSKYGYDNVKVKAISANIDKDIVPENIRSGINILGVEGSYGGIDTSGATATENDILKDKTAFANGEQITGTIEEYDGSYSGNTATQPKITNANGLFYTGARIDYINEFLSLCENITTTNNMFYKCTNITSLDLTGLLDTSEVTSMSSMFNDCSQLTQLNLSGCYTTKVTNMNSMFAYCNKLKKLDIRNFTFDKVTNNQTMFSSVPKSCEIIVKSDTEKQWVLARRSDFTNVKTVAELG